MIWNVLMWVGVVLLISGAFIGGAFFGFLLRKPVEVGTLLVIRDPNDGDTYMTLEVKKNMSDHIYDGNEITLKVVERHGKFPQKKQTL